MKKSNAKTKHKPATSHVLDEVLESLQDVLKNELADEALDNKDAHSDTAERDSVLSSLKELISETEKKSDKLSRQAKKKSKKNKAAKKKAAKRSTDDDPQQSAVDAESFALEMEDAIPSEPAATDSASHGGGDPRLAPPSPAQVEIGWDDIPVLEEVVIPSPLAGFNGAISPEVREIAIKVVAALNIERRKDGVTPLNVRTIMRLQALLARELAAHDLAITPKVQTDPRDAD